MNHAEKELVDTILLTLHQFPKDWRIWSHKQIIHQKSGICLDWYICALKVSKPEEMELSLWSRIKLFVPIRKLYREMKERVEREKEEAQAKKLHERIVKYSTRDEKFIHEL